MKNPFVFVVVAFVVAFATSLSIGVEKAPQKTIPESALEFPKDYSPPQKPTQEIVPTEMRMPVEADSTPTEGSYRPKPYEVVLVIDQNYKVWAVTAGRMSEGIRTEGWVEFPVNILSEWPDGIRVLLDDALGIVVVDESIHPFNARYTWGILYLDNDNAELRPVGITEGLDKLLNDPSLASQAEYWMNLLHGERVCMGQSSISEALYCP